MGTRHRVVSGASGPAGSTCTCRSQAGRRSPEVPQYATEVSASRDTVRRGRAHMHGGRRAIAPPTWARQACHQSPPARLGTGFTGIPANQGPPRIAGEVNGRRRRRAQQVCPRHRDEERTTSAVAGERVGSSLISHEATPGGSKALLVGGPSKRRSSRSCRES